MSLNLKKELKDAATVAISGHIRPDGDCVGSTLALYNYIKTYFPEISVDLYLEEIPNVFKFLTNADEICHDATKDKKYDIFFILDCSDVDRLGAFGVYYERADKKICIDHHVSNQAFADVNYIVPHASSTCELVYDCMEDADVTKEIAECIYTGMIHDTGVFQYSCTSEKTMTVAGRLMTKGIEFSKIVDETFYTKTFEQNKILGQALLNCKLYGDGTCIASCVSQEEMKQYHVLPKHLDGIVNQLRVTKDVEVAIFLYENEDGTYKVSTRATGDVNLAKIAMKYHGGGHAKAAGFSMSGDVEEIILQIVEDVKAQL